VGNERMPHQTGTADTHGARGWLAWSDGGRQERFRTRPTASQPAVAERTAAAELSPFPVRVGGELGDELGGRNLLACSENWLQGGEQSDALGWLVALVRQVDRRGARPLGPKAPGDVSDRQQQTPVRRHPVAEARRHNRICILKQQSIIGGPAHELRRSVVKSSSSTWRKSATCSLGSFGHSVQTMARLAIVSGKFRPSMPMTLGQNASNS